MDIKQTLPFYDDEIPHNSSRTLVAGPIDFRYAIEGVWFSFKKNTQDMIKVKVYVSSDSQATDGVEPVQDTNILPPYAYTDYITGDDTTFFLPMYYEVEIKPSYLKIYIKNDDPADEHILDVKVIIVPREEI